MPRAWQDAAHAPPKPWVSADYLLTSESIGRGAAFMTVSDGRLRSTNVASSVYQYPAAFALPRRFMLAAKASF